MSLYQCDNCGCVENTACGFYHMRNMEKLVRPAYRGKALCSACGPKTFPSGEETGYGKWHGRFTRKFYLLGSLYTDQQGNVKVRATDEYPTREDELIEITLDNGQLVMVAVSSLMVCDKCKKKTLRGKEICEGGGVVCTDSTCDYGFCY